MQYEGLGVAAKEEQCGLVHDASDPQSSRPRRTIRIVVLTGVLMGVLMFFGTLRALLDPRRNTSDAMKLRKPFRLYSGDLQMPDRADQYDGVEDKRDVNVVDKDGTAHVFVIGDWGATLPNHMTFASQGGWDQQAQGSVATAFKNRAEWAHPQYVLNVGDNFYVSGLDLSCNAPPGDQQGVTTSQFSGFWQSMYGEVANVPWLSVLGNHDYGGWRMDKGWPQQIGYSFINHNWIMPARYYSKRISHPGFDIDYFMIDSNAFDAKDHGAEPDHNICGMHNCGGIGTCVNNGGMSSIEGCKPWFWDSYAKQKAWLEEKIKASDARWKIVVTHFPCGYDAGFYKKLKTQYGLDLLVTGHRHQQELWKPGSKSKYIQSFLSTNGWSGDAPACFVTGGGGGIVSQKFAYADYGEDLQWYGFFHLTINKDWIKMELVGTDNIVHGNMTIHPHGSAQAAKDASAASAGLKDASDSGNGICGSYCGDFNNPWGKVCSWGSEPWMSCAGCDGCHKDKKKEPTY